MKSFIRTALVAAAGFVALSLSAHAAGSTKVTDTPLFKSTTTTMPMQLARNENPGGGMFGGMYKKTHTKKKAKKK
jgi:hypothetical protein